MLSRRQALAGLGQGCLAVCLAPVMRDSFASADPGKSLRCVNIVNFIREVEPRFEMDMMLPVRRQMELIRKHGLPATWLLQFDALVSGPFVDYLKENMDSGHEAGLWFEMNERHCRAAGVEWRGRAGYEWDHIPHVAFSIGYTKEERIRLADTAMEEFRRIWGRYPKSLASWNLDSFTMGHLADRCGMDAFAVCRDQIATDGFTIWGAPIAGYYPSRENFWSPALSRDDQIGTPTLRMLGQDPVYYYDTVWKAFGGQEQRYPDTMEPAWPSGRTPVFIREFLRMISEAPTLDFAYFQAGQENTFPWDQQSEGYPLQMEALAALRRSGLVHIETMGETGRRFKRAFKATPLQAQVQLEDPFGNTDPASASIWHQSRHFRANLHIRGALPFLRDITVYRKGFAQPHLDQATRETFVEQRLPAVIDGYHWSREPGSLTARPAGGWLQIDGRDASVSGRPVVEEDRTSLSVRLPISGGGELALRFDEKTLSASLSPRGALSLSLEWDPAKTAFTGIEGRDLAYQFQGFRYRIRVLEGRPEPGPSGVVIRSGVRGIRLSMAEPKS